MNSYPFSDYTASHSTVEWIDIDFSVLENLGMSDRHYIIEREGEMYRDSSGTVIDSHLIEEFLASFTDLYVAREFEEESVMTSYYPSFLISIIHSGGEIAIVSRSNTHCNIPWNVTMSGQNFVQFNGKIPTALFTLLMELDEEKWSFMDKEARFNCFPAPIPPYYVTEGLSPSFPHTSPEIPLEEEKGRTHIFWTAELDDYMAQLPLACYGNVYCVTKDRLICFDMATGEKKWDIDSETEIESNWFFAPGFIDCQNGNLYIRLEKGLACLDSHTGDILWKITGGELKRDPIYRDEHVYIIVEVSQEESNDTSETLRLLCVDSRTGNTLWEFTFLNPGFGYLDEEVYVEEERVYVNSGDPAVYCLDTQGTVIWDFTGHHVEEFHVLKNNIVLMNASQEVLTCVDRETGTITWENFDLSEIFTVYVVSDNSILISMYSSSTIPDMLVNVETGEILWEGILYGEGKEDLVNEDIRYLITDTRNTVCALQVSTGEELWKYTLDYEIQKMYMLEDGILLAEKIEEDYWPHIVPALIFLDREGNIQWNYPYGPQRTCTQVDIYDRDSLLITTTQEGIIEALDRTTGTVVWSTELKGREIFEVLFHNGHIFCSCDDGRMYCISEATGEIRWVVNTESGFTLSLGVLDMDIEFYGKFLLLSVEDTFIGVLVPE